MVELADCKRSLTFQLQGWDAPETSFFSHAILEYLVHSKRGFNTLLNLKELNVDHHLIHFTKVAEEQCELSMSKSGDFELAVRKTLLFA